MGTPDDNIELAQAAYRAIATGDIPWMQEHTHPQVVFQQGGRFPTAGTFHGAIPFDPHAVDDFFASAALPAPG